MYLLILLQYKERALVLLKQKESTIVIKLLVECHDAEYIFMPYDLK